MRGGRRHLSLRRSCQNGAGQTTPSTLQLEAGAHELLVLFPCLALANGEDWGASVAYSTTKLRMYSRSFCRLH